MTAIYNQSAPKKATNVSLNSDILALAKQHKINLSSLLERSLTEVLKQKIAEEWEVENAQAIEQYNEQVVKNGVFSDGLRSF